MFTPGLANGAAGEVTKVTLTPAMALVRTCLCRAESDNKAVSSQAVRALCLSRNEDIAPFISKLFELTDQSNIDLEERKQICVKIVECLCTLNADSGSSTFFEQPEYEGSLLAQCLKNNKKILPYIFTAMINAIDEGWISGCGRLEVSYDCATSPLLALTSGTWPRRR